MREHTGAVATDAIRTAEESAPTTELVTGAVADRCSNCQAPLAPDQRYCVTCGERRGRPRFSGEMLGAQAASVAVESAVPPRRRYPRRSSATTLITGVATLLIAMGVGVLIGHDSNSTPAHTPAAQIITVGGGGSASTGATTGSNTTASTTSGKKVKAKPTVVHITAKTEKAATAAASKVLGSSANKNLSNNVQQQVGGSCSGGAGCQGGKFTGNFFPSG